MDPTLTIPSYFGGYGPPARFRQRNNPIDAKKYDFRAQRTNLTHPNSVPESIIHLSMCGLGVGLVAMHTAYAECGLWTALGLNVAMTALMGYCVCALVWSAQKLYGRVQVATLTYPDTVEACILLSPWPKFRKSARCFRYALEGFLLIHLYGICCTCVIMIGRNLKELVEGKNVITDFGDPPLKVYILGLLAPCIVISMAKNLKFLAPFTLVCSANAVAVILTLLWYGLRVEHTPFVRPTFKGIMGIYQFICVCAFVLETGSYALFVENNMDTPKKFHYVILGTMTIFTVTMMIVGFIGYWRYGELSTPPLTVHFPYEPCPIMVKIFVCLMHYVIYATSFCVGFDIEWFYLKRNHIAKNRWFWEGVYRALHVIAIIVATYFLPNVTRMMGVLGAFATTPTIFIFPPFIQLIVDWEYPGLGRWKWRLFRYLAFLIFGVSTVVVGAYCNVYSTIIQLRMDFTSQKV